MKPRTDEQKHNPLLKFKPFFIYWDMMQRRIDRIEIPLDKFLVREEGGEGINMWTAMANHRGQRLWASMDVLPFVYEDLLPLCEEEHYVIVSVAKDSITIKDTLKDELQKRRGA